MDTFRIRITLSGATTGEMFTLKTMVCSIHRELVGKGGSAYGAPDRDSMLVEAMVPAGATLDAMLARIAEYYRAKNRDCTIAVIDDVVAELTEQDRQLAEALRVDGARLSRKRFQTIPAGLYLVSNCCNRFMEPVFAETVSSADERDVQWQRIVAARADQRLCRVFHSEAHFRKWARAFESAMGQ